MIKHLLLIFSFATISFTSNCQIVTEADSNLVIQFENASIDIAPGYAPLLYKLADSLQSNPDLHILIRGHVCCVKRNKLAKKRAKTVYYKLLQYGVSKQQMKWKGFKNTIPIIYPEESHEDELKNMRVDFVFYRND